MAAGWKTAYGIGLLGARYLRLDNRDPRNVINSARESIEAMASNAMRMDSREELRQTSPTEISTPRRNPGVGHSVKRPRPLATPRRIPSCA